METSNFHDIHEKYIQQCLGILVESESIIKDESLLSGRLLVIEKNYLAEVLSLEHGEKIEARGVTHRRRKAVSWLKKHLFQDIASRLNLDANLVSNKGNLLQILSARENRGEAGFKEGKINAENKENNWIPPKFSKELVQQEFNKLGWYEELMTYSSKLIQEVQIDGKKIFSLARQTWFTSQFWLNPASPSWFYTFVSWIYGKEFGEECARNKVRAYFDELWGYKALMLYKHRQISNIKIWGRNIQTIASRCGFTHSEGGGFQTLLWFQEFVSWLYGIPQVQYPQLLRNLIKKEIDGLWGEKVLINYGFKYLSSLEIDGRKIPSLAPKTWFRSLQGLEISTPDGLQEFVLWLYGKEFSVTMPLEVIKFHFDELWGYEALMKYNGHQITDIQIGTKKIRTIVSQSGFECKVWCNITAPRHFCEFVSWVYGKPFTDKGVKRFRPGLVSLEKLEEKFNELWGYEALMKYTKTQIRNIKIDNLKIYAIVSHVWFISKFGLYIYDSCWFQEFVSWLYDKPFTPPAKKA